MPDRLSSQDAVASPKHSLQLALRYRCPAQEHRWGIACNPVIRMSARINVLIQAAVIHAHALAGQSEAAYFFILQQRHIHIQQDFRRKSIFQSRDVQPGLPPSLPVRNLFRPSGLRPFQRETAMPGTLAITASMLQLLWPE